MFDFDVRDGIVVLHIDANENAVPPDSVIVDISFKRLIWLVWLGTVIIVAGVALPGCQTQLSIGYKGEILMSSETEIVQNKKARFEYEILDTIEAGIVLKGTEVKSVRLKKVNIQDAYARIKDGEAFLYGMNISAYEGGNIFNHDQIYGYVSFCYINKR